MRRFRLPIHRLVDRVAIDREGCWIFTGYVNPANGYGYIGVGTGEGKRLELCHRVAHEAWIGPIPEGYDVHHTCEVRACCNPAHLRAVVRGENAGLGGAAKLTPEIVREIRASQSTGVALATRLGVSANCISKVRTGRTWTWI